METWTINSNPEDFKVYMNTCKEAYENVKRWDDWKSYWEPLDADLNYSRSRQLWFDIEEGETILDRNDFKLAKEYAEYIDNLERDYEEYLM